MFLMDVSMEKEEFAERLKDYIRIVKAKLQVDYDLELSEIMGIDHAQISRWKSTANNQMPGGMYGTRLVNFFLDHIGPEAFELYDLMGWDRPKCPHIRDSRDGTS